MRRYNQLFLLCCTVILLVAGGGESVCAQVQASAPPVPRGIMTFGGAKILLEVKTLDLPYISGITPFFKWSDLEKEDGVYDFRNIDELIAMAKPKGKIVNLMFSSGMHAPEWLFQKGVKTSSWTTYWKENKWEEMGQSSVLKTPVPWDPVYLEYWKRFITKIAEKYASEPTVGYISITGPVQRGLTTTIAAKNEDDLKRLAAAGYSDEKLLNAWIDMIEHYEKVLRNKRLILALAVDVRGKPAIHRAQALVNYVEDKHYTNISFFVVFLNDTWFRTSNTTRRIRDLLEDAKAKGYSFGYQMGQSAERGKKWRRSSSIINSLRDSLAIGIGDGASWIEVWHPDIIDPRATPAGSPNLKYVDDLKWASGMLLKGAPQ